MRPKDTKAKEEGFIIFTKSFHRGAHRTKKKARARYCDCCDSDRDCVRCSSPAASRATSPSLSASIHVRSSGSASASKGRRGGLSRLPSPGRQRSPHATQPVALSATAAADSPSMEASGARGLRATRALARPRRRVGATVRGRSQRASAAAEGEEALRELAASGRATLSDYLNARLSLLDHVPHANPRFAKLAFGRGAMWALIQEGWEELCEWTVFFVRRLQLARNPDLAYTFLMLNSGNVKESLHSETSPHDDDWATKLPVPKGLESPLDVLLPAHGDDAVAEALWERVRIAAPTRRLGRANVLVAHSLLAPEAFIEGKSAAAVALRAAGWVAWVDRCLPGEGSLLSPPRLPFEADALPALRPWLEALSEGLIERAEEAAQSRSPSRSQSQQ